MPAWRRDDFIPDWWSILEARRAWHDLVSGSWVKD